MPSKHLHLPYPTYPTPPTLFITIPFPLPLRVTHPNPAPSRSPYQPLTLPYPTPPRPLPIPFLTIPYSALLIPAPQHLPTSTSLHHTTTNPNPFYFPTYPLNHPYLTTPCSSPSSAVFMPYIPWPKPRPNPNLPFNTQAVAGWMDEYEEGRTEKGWADRQTGDLTDACVDRQTDRCTHTDQRQTVVPYASTKPYKPYPTLRYSALPNPTLQYLILPYQISCTAPKPHPSV